MGTVQECNALTICKRCGSACVYTSNGGEGIVCSSCSVMGEVGNGFFIASIPGKKLTGDETKDIIYLASQDPLL